MILHLKNKEFADIVGIQDKIDGLPIIEVLRANNVQVVRNESKAIQERAQLTVNGGTQAIKQICLPISVLIKLEGVLALVPPGGMGDLVLRVLLGQLCPNVECPNIPVRFVGCGLSSASSRKGSAFSSTSAISNVK